ncbi:MAG: 1-acyl-sn-glycerol-3-phosphate acyltransferase [Pseudomonadales bacterium]|nr:1-acyl-sn-glycerol-3-phosphate acyltransferase [Pseudomonadales bacterium]
MPFIRGVMFNIGYAASIILFGTFSIFVLVWLPFKQRYFFATQWVNFLEWWLRVTCGITHRVIGLENLPQQPCVIVSNHQSTWETFFLQRYFAPQSTVMKRELMWIPFFGWVIRFMKPIVINRSQRTGAMKQILRQGEERLKTGLWVLIFPEGTRVPSGEFRPHFPGGAMLAVKAGVPIVPLVHNAGRVWPAHNIRKYPGQITIKFGDPIDTAGKKPKEITESVKQWLDTEKENLPIA